MRTRIGLILALFVLAPCLAGCQKDLDNPATLSPQVNQQANQQLLEEPKLTYPTTQRGDHVDNYHGRQIADPYRWLEDPDSPETEAWVDAQNEVTQGYLSGVPQRGRIRQRLEKLWDYERFGLPRHKGGRYFYTHNDGLQNQSVLFVTESLEAEPRVLLDPNLLSTDGTVDLASWTPSKDGKLLAYATSTAGSDWKEWGVLDVDSGKPLIDKLKWVKFSGVTWTADGQGLYYSRYDEPKADEEFTGANYYQKLFYHRLGQSQDEDELVYQRTDQKEWGFGSHVTEDGNYLIISVWRGSEPKNQVFYKDLQTPGAEVVELISGFDAEYDFVGNEGSVFWIVTDSDAPRRRMIAVDTASAQRSDWKEMIPQSDDVLEGVSLVGDRFIAAYLHDAHSQVKVFDLTGKQMGEVPLPAIGTAGGFGGRRVDTETFYAFTNYTSPTTIYRYDIASGESAVFRQPSVDFDPSDYETSQVFYESRDGTQVPMFITRRRDLDPAAEHPTILYGYGGFNISLTPGFSVSNLVWLEAGGVYAVPNLRGGGEYGRAWHEAGMQEKKQNVFDDFLAAAEWLIDNHYTSREKLAISGRSNGGLLVGAAMTQRPELFAAALPGVGVMDMLRYHKFTIGWAWVGEFGSSDDPEQFQTLLAYSPLHNLQSEVRYPATLVTTADHDDRVVPAHSHKFAATLQAAQIEGGPPVLIRIETSAGHGAGKPTSKRIDDAADNLAFLASVLKVDFE